MKCFVNLEIGWTVICHVTAIFQKVEVFNESFLFPSLNSRNFQPSTSRHHDLSLNTVVPSPHFTASGSACR